MYFPYFRGKQFELLTIRETTDLIAQSKFIPIIEPVKSTLSTLEKALDEIISAQINFVLIINPKVGDFKNDSTPLIKRLVEEKLINYTNYSLGYILDSSSNLLDVIDFINRYPDKKKVLIHCDFPHFKALLEQVKSEDVAGHIFVDGLATELYQTKFRKHGGYRVLVRDGFRKTKNADYPEDESFSDLHLTYEIKGFSGFGDFSIVGTEFSETGGPAYAVAIHVTYFDPNDGVIRIRHFLSKTVGTPVDPAGKFLEALERLMNWVNEEDSPVLKTQAILEFEDLYSRQHFPGLGIVKKISMKHHLELMSQAPKD